jgi:hypothetical protein
MALRMQVRQLRGLIWVATLGLAALAGWNLWTIVQRMRAKQYEPKSPTYFEQLIGSASGSIDQGEVKLPDWEKDYKPILVETPINGYVKEPPKPVAVEPTEKLPAEKKISEVLTVTAIASAPDNGGRVVVKYKDDTVKPTKDEIVLKVGASLTPPYDYDPFKGRLKEIRPDSAIFDWCGKDVEVHPPRQEDVAAAPKPEKAAPGAKFDATLSADERAKLEQNKEQKKTVSYAPDSYVVGTEDYNQISSDAEGYLKEARLSEIKNANGQKELTVGAIRPNSALARTYGVQSGDSLISINGEPVSTKAQAYSYVREHSDLSKYVVVLRRKGREVTKTVLVNRNK